jgi:peroxiredoxin
MFGIQPYNYESFNRRQMVKEFAPRPWRAPEPGAKAPAFKLSSLDGEKFRLSDFRGRKNVVLTFGSATCPMTAGSIAGLNDLADEYQGKDVQFLFVYVREAHPGDEIPAHLTIADKQAAAEVLREHEDVEIPILLDDLRGSTHRSYGYGANSSFVIDKSGRIAFRALWTQPKVLAEALKELLNLQRRGRDRAIVRGGEDRSIPIRYGILHSERALRRAGGKARREFHSAAGPAGRILTAAGRVAEPMLHPGKILIGTALAMGVTTAGLVGGMLLRKRRLDRMRQPYYYPRRSRFAEPGGYEAVGI